MPLGTLKVASRLQYWICENAKSARAYLKRVNEIVPLGHALQSLQAQVSTAHTTGAQLNLALS